MFEKTISRESRCSSSLSSARVQFAPLGIQNRKGAREKEEEKRARTYIGIYRLERKYSEQRKDETLVNGPAAPRGMPSVCVDARACARRRVNGRGRMYGGPREGDDGGSVNESQRCGGRGFFPVE